MIKVSKHMEAILKEIAKKDRLKPEECFCIGK
jgi:hypothetical protein